MDWTQIIIAALGGGALIEIIRRILPSKENILERLWNEMRSLRDDLVKSQDAIVGVRKESDAQFDALRREKEAETELYRRRIEELGKRHTLEIDLHRSSHFEWQERYFLIKMRYSTVFLQLGILRKLVSELYKTDGANKALETLIDTIKDIDFGQEILDSEGSYGLAVWRKQTDEVAIDWESLDAMEQYIKDKRETLEQARIPGR